MSEFEKVQCTCAHGYTCRAMTDPNCCAHSCDYNDVVDALNKVTAERDAALAQSAALASVVVELPKGDGDETGWLVSLTEVEDALDAAGVKYK